MESNTASLVNLSTILNNLSALEKCKKESVADLVQELADARRAIHRCKSLGIEALSNPHYLRACMLDDCARSAPEGIFDRKSGVRICFPKTILENWTKPLLVVGAPGFGKTSFCKWHALQDAERFTTGVSRTLPVYVPLYRLSYEPGDSFEKTFLKTLGKSALINNGDSQVNRTVRVYLDGLDEVPSHERRREIVELARKGIDSNKSYQVILTSRDYVYGRWLDFFPRVALGGFEHTDIMELIDKWLGSSSESHKRFCEQIEKMPALRSLMQTPLLATLVVLVFRQTGKLPESRPRLYEIFIDLLSGGWDLAKGVLRESRFGQTVKVMILTGLAASLQEHRRREFYGHDLKSVIGSTLSTSMLTEWEGIQYELLIDGLITKSGSVMQFCHHSFQEYLAAKNLLGNPEPISASRALESYMCGDDWWKEVIVFYIGLSTNPTELTSWISNQIRRISSLHYVNLKPSQIQDLRTAVAEAFPNLSSDSLRLAYI